MPNCAFTKVSYYRRRRESVQSIFDYRPGIDKEMEGMIISETHLNDGIINEVIRAALMAFGNNALTIEIVKYSRMVVYSSRKRLDEGNVIIISPTCYVRVIAASDEFLMASDDPDGHKYIDDLNKYFKRPNKDKFFLDLKINDSRNFRELLEYTDRMRCPQ